ncbi:helix-turn-helix domain-containing protein [Halobacteriaceae archaeon GCM10025711]
MDGGVVTATFTLQSDDSHISRLVLAAPDVRIEVERTVPLGRKTEPTIRVFAEDGRYDAFERVLDADASVASWDEIGRFDGGRSYRLGWADGPGRVCEALARHDAAVQSFEGDDGACTCRARFPDHDAVSAFYRDCRDESMDIDVVRVRRSDGERSPDDGLTRPQRRALELAYEHGYFDVPRQSTTVELADRLGVSDQALSERLRRAFATLVEQTVQPDPVTRRA